MKKLLLIVEHGGIPLYPRELSELGYAVTTVNSMRQALAALKRETPDIVLAEFNFVSTFRDRISNLESLLARLETTASGARVVVLYEPGHAPHLERIKDRYTIFESLSYPASARDVTAALERASR